MKRYEIQKAIERIERMEQCFDTLSEIVRDNREEPRFNELQKELLEYYESGQWMYDYELDEKGVLPQNLKRGVLSEDGVYNLLTDIDRFVADE